jgi:hypothetical protein
MSTAPDRSDPEAPRRYEYYTAETDWPLKAKDLDTLGRKGWRMCGVVRDGGLIVYHFTRPAKGG